ACRPDLVGRPSTAPLLGRSTRQSLAKRASSHAFKTSNGPGKGCRVGVLLPGGLFGALPTSDAEPFTVQCIASCEVFYISRSEMSRVPNKLLNAISEYLVHSITYRLSRCTEKRQNPDLVLPGRLGSKTLPGKVATPPKESLRLPAGQDRLARAQSAGSLGRRAPPPMASAAFSLASTVPATLGKSASVVERRHMVAEAPDIRFLGAGQTQSRGSMIGLGMVPLQISVLNTNSLGLSLPLKGKAYSSIGNPLE
ncbi:unnamed protein product, partial [Polarella glacialis]